MRIPSMTIAVLTDDRSVPVGVWTGLHKRLQYNDVAESASTSRTLTAEVVHDCHSQVPRLRRYTKKPQPVTRIVDRPQVTSPARTAVTAAGPNPAARGRSPGFNGTRPNGNAVTIQRAAGAHRPQKQIAQTSPVTVEHMNHVQHLASRATQRLHVRRIPHKR